eukprot:gene3236-3814_t
MPMGARVMLSTPEAITISIVPLITAWAANCSACCGSRSAAASAGSRAARSKPGKPAMKAPAFSYLRAQSLAQTSALLREHGDELDDVTLGGLADGVFLGGYETSASMLALGTYLLVQHREAMTVLRDGDDAAVDGVVEELLRHLTVVQLAFLRFAREDLELGGQRIKAGDCIGISLLGANRDPALTPDADTFDPRRAPTRHLAF